VLKESLGQEFSGDSVIVDVDFDQFHAAPRYGFSYSASTVIEIPPRTLNAPVT
jgi:hypothetical protein